jgi:UDPglucose 6-dehydrogenase
MTAVAVVGTGYVGLSMAVLLSEHNDVVALDIDADRVALLRSGRSPISDPDLEEHLAHRDLRLAFTTDPDEAYAGARFVVIATPTNYDPVANYFDTSSVEQVAADVAARNPEAVMVVKSTVPVGFTGQLSTRLGGNIIFSPEFLRARRSGQSCAASEPSARVLRPGARRWTGTRWPGPAPSAGVAAP